MVQSECRVRPLCFPRAGLVLAAIAAAAQLHLLRRQRRVLAGRSRGRKDKRVLACLCQSRVEIGYEVGLVLGESDASMHIL